MRRFQQLVIGAVGIALLATGTHAQQPKTWLKGVLVPGQALRFEVETHTSYSADLDEGYATDPPIHPCEYSVSAKLGLQVGPGADQGNVSVTAKYDDVVVTNWQCPQLSRMQAEKELRRFASSPVVYQVGPHGEPGFQRDSRDRFGNQSAQDLLSKVALDLIETRLSDHPVAPGDTWKPRGQFAYWKDYLLNGLELSSSRMLWKSTPRLASHNYALVASKYIFSPTESSSGPVRAGGDVRQPASNVLSGMLKVSLLLDPQSSHIVWLDRQYVVENHVSVQPVAEPDPEVLTVRWDEKAKARLLPDENGIEWLTAVKQFESIPDPAQSGTISNPASRVAPSEIARIAKPKKQGTSPEIESLDFTPSGFSRWDRRFCNGGWYCTNISVALPGEVEIAEDAALQTVYFARTDQPTFVVTVGPVLQRKYQGLTSEEELSKHTDFYLANQLWMENRPGVAIESESTLIDGYSSRITTFRGVRRDLSAVQGELLILLSPWGDSFPVTCTAKQTESTSLHETCTRILHLIRLQRVE
jgi:hypothetical protein